MTVKGGEACPSNWGFSIRQWRRGGGVEQEKKLGLGVQALLFPLYALLLMYHRVPHDVRICGVEVWLHRWESIEYVRR